MSFIFAEMRLSAFILDLLVLFMILVPCRDHKDLGLGKVGSPHFFAASQDKGQTDDNCSPLCTCSCCTSVSHRVHKTVVEGIVPVPVVKKVPIYIARAYSAERSAVWQPPRIA